MRLLYNLFIRLYQLTAVILAAFNHKAGKWVAGRKDLLTYIDFEIDHEDDHVWFHCASLGEFEQGRPVIERFGKENPDYKIVVTFFSPSGYDVRKNYQGADYVFYLPHDTQENATKFIEHIFPRLAIFIKYEFWFNYINILSDYKIPVVFISVIFRKNHIYFKWWAKWYRDQLKKITYYFVQDKNSAHILEKAGIKNVIVSGDTRFDRVNAIKEHPKSFYKIEKFIQGSFIFIAGSTWPVDDDILIPLINNNYKGIKYIIAPHQINGEQMRKINDAVQGSVVRYSEYDEEKFRNAQVLVIDQIGMLSSVYQYASVAYVGGGLGKSIHNVLEPATFGMPVIFGTKYTKFSEAIDLVRLGAAFPVKNAKELEDTAVNLMSDYELLKKTSAIASQYVERKKGATDTIMLFLNAIISPGGFNTKNLEKHIMN